MPTWMMRGMRWFGADLARMPAGARRAALDQKMAARPPMRSPEPRPQGPTEWTNSKRSDLERGASSSRLDQRNRHLAGSNVASFSARKKTHVYYDPLAPLLEANW